MHRVIKLTSIAFVMFHAEGAILYITLDTFIEYKIMFRLTLITFLPLFAEFTVRNTA